MPLKIFHIILLFVYACNAIAQPISYDVQANAYYNKGLQYFKSRDFANAIIEYREALALDKNNLIFNREYAYAFYLNEQFGNAAFIIEKAILLPDADEKTFQLACSIFSAASDKKSATNAIDNGLIKFPNSAILLSEKAQLLYTYKQDDEAIALWQKAIQAQVNYYPAYYALANALDTNTAYLPQTIVLAETYILADPYSPKTKTMKMLLYKCYQQMYKQFIETKQNPSASNKGLLNNKFGFEQAYFKMLKTNKFILLNGLSLDKIIEWRTLCTEEMLETKSGSTIPALFMFHQQLMHEQLFEVYHHWLLESVSSEKKYNEWMMNQKESFALFEKYLRENQFYKQ
jgi:tetratricopeptide (TPR) repeat protein